MVRLNSVISEEERQTRANNTQLMPLCDDSTSHHHGFKLVGDNIDLTVSTRYMRVENYRDQSLHYFHCYAVLDRINMDSLSLHLTPTCHPCPTHMALSLLPSQEHDTILRKNIAILISRVLVTHMHFFQFAFSDAVTWHIHHKFYKEMSSKSTVVSLFHYDRMYGKKYMISFSDAVGCPTKERKQRVRHGGNFRSPPSVCACQRVHEGNLHSQHQ